MKINSEYITLSQFLKLAGFVNSGGEAKHRIHEFHILVDGVEENRRGRKLYPRMVITVQGKRFEIE